ncbi:40S ribosomal protein S4 [Actinomortierella wolfii]|nr:40S ribosomal protein S4 [Actinomortierella wolfii]
MSAALGSPSSPSSSSLPLPPLSSVTAEETAPSTQLDVQVTARPRNLSTENNVMRSRKREIIALDGFMFDSSVLHDTDDKDGAAMKTPEDNITPGTANTPSDRQEPNRTPSTSNSPRSSLLSDQQETSLRALHRNNAAEALAGNTRPAATPLLVDSANGNSSSSSKRDSKSNDGSTANGSEAQQLASPWPQKGYTEDDSQANDRTSGGQRIAGEELRNKTLSTSSVSSSSSTDESTSASSPTDSQTSPILEDDDSAPPFSSSDSSNRLEEGAHAQSSSTHVSTTPALSVLPPPAASKRQSIFVGDSSFGLDLAADLTASSASSTLDNAGVDQDDMKEVQIETENPSHLFWVPFHLHPEIAPNEYNKWLIKHGVQADGPDGLLSTTRRGSVRRRKSVLSSQYNPEEDNDETTEVRHTEPNREKEEETRASSISSGGSNEDKLDFLSGVFKSPLSQMGEPPLKKMTSLRRSVSLSIQSPTRDGFPDNVVEEDLAQVKRAGLGGQSLLRRSARTKIRRNSTASNDTRVDASRIRPVLSESGEYQAVSLVDPGPMPLPSENGENASTDQLPAQEKETKPLRRFVSTLRDPSKPTITTYVEPHLLEQQRKEAEEESKAGIAVETTVQVTSPFRTSAPGQLETPIPTPDPTRKEAQTPARKIDPVSYPIPPPVKLPQNLLQKSSSTVQSPPQVSKPTKPGKQQSSTSTSASHSKKPSTWSWLWGKEKEKSNDRTSPHSTSTADGQQSALAKSINGTMPTEDTQTTTPVDASSKMVTATATTATTTNTTTAVKKQSTFSMLFSRGTKSAAHQQTQSSTSESTQEVIPNGTSGQAVYGTQPAKPRYTNYNRLPIHIERAIYRLSHVKLANPRRPLHEQVLISNMMFWYLGVIQQQQMLQQQQQQEMQQQQMQQMQEAAEQQRANGNGDGKSKDAKSKSKPKKRKSQKKKNGQRGGASKAEVAFKSPQYDVQQQEIISQQYSSQAAYHQQQMQQHQLQLQLQQQQQQQQQHQQKSAHQYYNQQPSQPSQVQGATADTDMAADEHGHVSRGELNIDEYDEESMIGGGYSDPIGGSEGDRAVPSASGMVSGRSVQAYGGITTTTIIAHDSDDDVPLAHYQHVQRQGVPARGPKKHLKRLNAPKHWMLDKLTGTYAPRPSSGPHKLRECLPLIILMRNRLKYALNGKEVQSILMQRLIKVDGKVRTDSTYPAGFMDTISIEKTGENFRLVYDTKGRFTVHRITEEEAKYKLCKVKKVQVGAKGIPFIVTHDGRTLRYPDPLIKVNDTVKLDLETGKFNEFVKFEVGNVAMVTGGRNTGRVGVITHRERHIGGFDIVHIKDVLDRQFATRVSNVFVLGEGNKPWVSLPKNKGVKLTIAEERDRRRAAASN